MIAGGCTSFATTEVGWIVFVLRRNSGGGVGSSHVGWLISHELAIGIVFRIGGEEYRGNICGCDVRVAFKRSISHGLGQMRDITRKLVRGGDERLIGVVFVFAMRIYDIGEGFGC